MGRETRLWVRTPSARYPVWIGAGLLGRAGRHLARVRPANRRVYLVSSPRVWSLWGEPLAASLKSAGLRVEALLTDDREAAKRLRSVEHLAERLLHKGADRNALLAALGGGVIGDLTGFLAASYMRGVDYVQLPTTLVAQMDSAIGGKTGVNLREGKNLLGAFHHPRAVLADTHALDTLPAREYRAGLYEVIKSAVVGDPGLFRFLERHMSAVLRHEPRAVRTILVRSIRVKAGIVARDEREHGLRRILNFGHTFGHALETLGCYRGLRHGEAIAWGMIAATRLAARLGRLEPREAERILRLLAAVGSLPAPPQVSPEQVYEQLFADKKKRGDRLRFVLPRRIGRVEILGDVPRADVLASVRGLATALPSR